MTRSQEVHTYRIHTAGSRPRSRRFKLYLCFVCAFIAVSSPAFAGPEDPPIHVWATFAGDWGFGTIIFPHDTYLIVGPLKHRLHVSAASAKRVVVGAAVCVSLLIAAVALAVRRRQHHSDATFRA